MHGNKQEKEIKDQKKTTVSNSVSVVIRGCSHTHIPHLLIFPKDEGAHVLANLLQLLLCGAV